MFRIAESTSFVDESSYLTFCSSLLCHKGKDQTSGKNEHLVHHQVVLRSRTMSQNDLMHGDVEGWCKTVMNYNKG